jgi:tetratricopeptide (TPR) repeat protein
MIAGPLVLAVAWTFAQSFDAQTQSEREVLLERWRESIDLELPREVLDPGLEAVSSGGRLARDGEAIALVCRALTLTGGTARAETLASAASVEPSTEAWITVARARLALLDDDLPRVASLLLVPAKSKDSGVTARLRHPENAQCWLLLGRAWVRAGRSSDAEPLLVRFVEMAPLDAEAPAAWHMLAQAALARGALDVAAERQKRSEQSAQWQAFYRTRRLQIRESPEEPLPRLGLAQLWLAAEEFARAQSVLEDLVARAPEFCRGWASLGEALRRSGDISRARTAYDRALGCDPALSEALFDRGLLAAIDERWSDARTDLERLVDGPAASEPRFLRGHLELARALVRLDDRASAEKRFARYRELGGRELLE